MLGHSRLRPERISFSLREKRIRGHCPLKSLQNSSIFREPCPPCALGEERAVTRYISAIQAHNFDKGFGYIAAASSQYALIARLACSPSLRLYGHLLLFPKNLRFFGSPVRPVRLGRSGKRNGAGDMHTNVIIQIMRDRGARVCNLILVLRPKALCDEIPLKKHLLSCLCLFNCDIISP